jgi:hypothetical protein
MAKQINYSKRDFASLQEEERAFIRRYYPEVIQNLNDASIISVYIDLNAAIADNLNFNIDRSLQETVLDYAQQRSSLYNIAKTYGLKLPSRSASIAVCEFSVEVPVLGDAEDERYLPIMKSGSQFVGAGQVFETIYDVDFSNPISVTGAYDRLKIPNYSGGKLVSYTIKKSAVVVNGASKIYTYTFGSAQVDPFFKLILPDVNVLSVDSVISKEGTGFVSKPTYDDFKNENLLWYPVKSLAENKVFVVDKSRPVSANGLYYGKYLRVDKRYIYEFTPTGYCVITFGSATDDSTDILDDFIQYDGIIDLKAFLNNRSLGVAPRPNTTMYVKYRVGGGEESNVGVGLINAVIKPVMSSRGPNAQTVAVVQSSLRCVNVTPAVGGAGAPNIEELRYYIGYNFAAQERAVSLEDYKTIVALMPSQFGTPARVGVTQEQNKIAVNLLSYDNSGALNNTMHSVLMENVAVYLSEYRMMNDYVQIQPGEVIDLAVEVEVLMEEDNYLNIVSAIIANISDLFETSNMVMGKSMYTGDIMKKVTMTNGVLDIVSLKVMNKVGGEYSSNTTSQPYTDELNRVIDTTDGIIYVQENQTLQLRFPDKDIIIKPKFATAVRA